MKIKDRILVTSAYIFGIPALYIVLTGYRKQEYLGHHGAQAFYLWCLYFIIFFAWRFLVDSVWATSYLPSWNIIELVILLAMGGYAAWCGYRGFLGKKFSLLR